MLSREAVEKTLRVKSHLKRKRVEDETRPLILKGPNVHRKIKVLKNTPSVTCNISTTMKKGAGGLVNSDLAKNFASVVVGSIPALKKSGT